MNDARSRYSIARPSRATRSIGISSHSPVLITAPESAREVPLLTTIHDRRYRDVARPQVAPRDRRHLNETGTPTPSFSASGDWLDRQVTNEPRRFIIASSAETSVSWPLPKTLEAHEAHRGVRRRRMPPGRRFTRVPGGSSDRSRRQTAPSPAGDAAARRTDPANT